MISTPPKPPLVYLSKTYGRGQEYVHHFLASGGSASFRSDILGSASQRHPLFGPNMALMSARTALVTQSSRWNMTVLCPSRFAGSFLRSKSHFCHHSGRDFGFVLCFSLVKTSSLGLTFTYSSISTPKSGNPRTGAALALLADIVASWEML